jgi:hypothetical protein
VVLPRQGGCRGPRQVLSFLAGPPEGPRALSHASCTGRDLETASKLRRWLEQAGFVDVDEVRIDCPGNGWPDDPRLRRMGRYLEADAAEGAQGMSLKLLSRGLGMSVDDINVLVGQVKEDLHNTDIHILWPW